MIPDELQKDHPDYNRIDAEVASGSYTPGSIAPSYQLLNGTDTIETTWRGIVMSEKYPPTGQILEQYWFLRGGETGLHTFSRLAYHNSTTPFLQNLQEFRTLFRPNTRFWTHLSTNARQFAPLPCHNPATGDPADAITVQDATWYLPNRSELYVLQESDYFTKYTFADTWRNHKVHGLFSNGSTSEDGSTFGAWHVMTTIDTYFDGPTQSDLTVDGIVYNYIVSNHHRVRTPNLTNGFDRTFGPGFYYLNPRHEGASLRGSWRGKVQLPEEAKRPVAALSQSGVDYQDNVFDTTAYQYWADIEPETGEVEISRIKAGTYRLTIYADGIFGEYEQDGTVISAGQTTTAEVHWREESVGIEVWRIGTPDKSGREYRRGDESDLTHPLHPEQYRIYWPFGRSDPVTDLNYVHWSVFGGYANSIRPERYYGDGNVNNWTILFDLSREQFWQKSKATFTVQLAGAKTAAGNTDVFNATQLYSNLPYTVVVNGEELEPWIIPYYQSSSCAVRSAVTCYNFAHEFVFDTNLLEGGRNEIVLSLPFNATDYGSALLPDSVYVQCDALRLETR